jgi:hypothetical protein
VPVSTLRSYKHFPGTFELSVNNHEQMLCFVTRWTVTENLLLVVFGTSSPIFPSTPAE